MRARRQGIAEPAANIGAPGIGVSKCLVALYNMSVITSRINPRLIMRLLPMRDPDKSWRSIKAQWKKDAEGVGEDFSTFSMGSFTAFDALTRDGENPSLYCLSDGERIHAACQVSRLMMSKFPTPMLRARFVVVSPVYELGLADSRPIRPDAGGAFFRHRMAVEGHAVGRPHPLLPEEPRRFTILRGAAGLDAAVAVFKVHDRGRLDRVQLEGRGAGGNRLNFLPVPCGGDQSRAGLPSLWF